MPNLTSNLNQVAARIRNVATCLSMRGRGRVGSIGSDLADLAAIGILDRTVLGQRSADGSPLAPLAERTKRLKARRGQPETIGVATGEMLALEQVKGDRTITSTRTVVEYGKSESARDKASSFQGGSRRRRRRQPPRPFFELDDAIEADCDDLVDEVVARTIREQGGG